MSGRGRLRPKVFSILLTAAWIGSARQAEAEPFDPARFLPTAGSCPSARAVWGAILEMVPKAWPQLLEAKSRPAIVESRDGYRVSVTTDTGTVERTFTDDAHDCAQRARYAATFIVLALMPPDIEDDPSAPPAPPPKPPSPTAHPTAPTLPAPALPIAAQPSHGPARSIVGVELGGTLTFSPALARAPGIIHWGAELRMQVGTGPVAGVLALGYMPATAFQHRGVDITSERLPALLGLRARARVAGLDTAFDCGFATAIARYSGRSPHDPRQASQIDLGVGAALILWPVVLKGFGAFVDVRASLFPVARDLVVLPQGTIAATPRMWIGAALGVSLAR